MKKHRTALIVLIFLTSILFLTKKCLEWFASDPDNLNQFFGMLSYHILYMGILPLGGWILFKSSKNS